MTFDALLSQQTHSFSSPALRQITLEVQKVGGINLGQGVCNLPPPDYILEQAEIAAKEGVNRYTNPRGLIELREALARKFAHFNDLHVDPEIDNKSKKDDGILSKLAFWKSDPPVSSKVQYRIYVADAGPQSTIQVLTPEGGADKSDTAKKILALLQQQLQ